MGFLTTFARAMPGLPPRSGWLALLIFIFLGLAAILDARKGRVPDRIVVTGLIISLVVQGCYVNWSFAGRHFLIALAAGAMIYLLNEIWYRVNKSDALGMGDGKWTVLAVDCFFLKPVLVAWGLGACLALLWMGAWRLAGRKIGRVYFVPFLWVGLAVGIYWWRFR